MQPLLTTEMIMVMVPILETMASTFPMILRPYKHTNCNRKDLDRTLVAMPSPLQLTSKVLLNSILLSLCTAIMNIFTHLCMPMLNQWIQQTLQMKVFGYKESPCKDFQEDVFST